MNRDICCVCEKPIEGEIVDIPAKTLDGFCAEMFGHVE